MLPHKLQDVKTFHGTEVDILLFEPLNKYLPGHP